MKKILIFTSFVVALLSTSCDKKEEFEQVNSSTVEVSGEYYVYYNHETYGEDPFGAGLTKVIISNTAADNGQEILLSDQGNFWDYTVKLPVNIDAMTFGSESEVTSVVKDYEIQVIVKNGKIIKDAVELPSGVMADSIYFEIWFEDLEDATNIANDKLLVGGFRKSGFLEDEPH